MQAQSSMPFVSAASLASITAGMTASHRSRVSNTLHVRSTSIHATNEGTLTQHSQILRHPPRRRILPTALPSRTLRAHQQILRGSARPPPGHLHGLAVGAAATPRLAARAAQELRHPRRGRSVPGASGRPAGGGRLARSKARPALRAHTARRRPAAAGRGGRLRRRRRAGPRLRRAAAQERCRAGGYAAGGARRRGARRGCGVDGRGVPREWAAGRGGGRGRVVRAGGSQVRVVSVAACGDEGLTEVRAAGTCRRRWPARARPTSAPS